MVCRGSSALDPTTIPKSFITQARSALSFLQILLQADEIIRPTRRTKRVAFVGLLEAAVCEREDGVGHCRSPIERDCRAGPRPGVLEEIVVQPTRTGGLNSSILSSQGAFSGVNYVLLSLGLICNHLANMPVVPKFVFIRLSFLFWPSKFKTFE
jgi:hypothetical protein